MIALDRGCYLPGFSRAAVGRVNLSPKREIMDRCKRPFPAGRRWREVRTQLDPRAGERGGRENRGVPYRPPSVLPQSYPPPLCYVLLHPPT